MTTATLRQLRHDFQAIEAAAQQSPVKITRRGRVIGTFTAAKRGRTRWVAPDLAARARGHFGARLTGLALIDELERGSGER